MSDTDISWKHHIDPRTSKRYAESTQRPEYTLTGPKSTKLEMLNLDKGMPVQSLLLGLLILCMVHFHHPWGFMMNTCHFSSVMQRPKKLLDTVALRRSEWRKSSVISDAVYAAFSEVMRPGRISFG